MTAKEMFEKLGYDMTLGVEHWSSLEGTISYTPAEKLDYVSYSKKDVSILFYKKEKYIKLEPAGSFSTHGRIYEITFEELQAINKQVEELGWK